MKSPNRYGPKPSASDFAEQQRRNDHRLPKSPSELMRRDPPNRMDLSPLSRPCFGCKLFPMKTIVFIFLLSLSTRAEEPVCKTVAECLYWQGRVESQLEELRKHPPPPQDKPGPTDNSNRVPQAMTHNEAIDYCNGLGGRRPRWNWLSWLSSRVEKISPNPPTSMTTPISRWMREIQTGHSTISCLVTEITLMEL